MDLTHEAFRLAVHPAKDRAMIAMATLNYGDLKIQVRAIYLCYMSDFTFYNVKC